MIIVVFLGTYETVSDDSWDLSMLGHEDPELPAAGYAFFYIVRYDEGLMTPTYSLDSEGRERILGSGDCLP